MKFFEDAQKGIASATGQPLARKEIGIPPKYFFVCAHCRRDLGPIPISMNILQGTLPIQVLKQAGNFMKQCPTCKLWVCPSCYNSETNRCIQCSPITAKQNISTPTGPSKFCSNYGNPLSPEAKFCSGCGNPVT